MRKLFYETCGTNEGEEGEDDRLVLTALYQSCPLLDELVLCHAPPVVLKAEMLSLIGRHCRHLRVLILISYRLSISSLRSIAGMEALQELKLNGPIGMTDAGMAVLSTMKLKLLRISEGGDCRVLSLQCHLLSRILAKL